MYIFVNYCYPAQSLKLVCFMYIDITIPSYTNLPADGSLGPKHVGDCVLCVTC